MQLVFKGALQRFTLLTYLWMAGRALDAYKPTPVILLFPLFYFETRGEGITWLAKNCLKWPLTCMVHVFVFISPSRGSLSRGNSGDADAYGTLPGTDDRRTVRIQLGGTGDDSERDSNEGTNSFHPVYQTQLAPRHETAYYYSSQQPTFDQSTTPSSSTVLHEKLRLLSQSFWCFDVFTTDCGYPL